MEKSTDAYATLLEVQLFLKFKAPSILHLSLNSEELQQALTSFITFIIPNLIKEIYKAWLQNLPFSSLNQHHHPKAHFLRSPQQTVEPHLLPTSVTFSLNSSFPRKKPPPECNNFPDTN
jgi:hypothetical protein